MAKMSWDATGSRFFHTGVSDVALFLIGQNGYQTGEAWSGVTGITQSPDGADAQSFYADNIKYLSIRAKENWKGTLKCFQYPESFNGCLGMKELVAGSGVYVGQQSRSGFGLVWKTKVGNDVLGEDAGYMIHIAYGLTAGPSEKENNTTNETPEAVEFSFDLESTPAAPETAIEGIDPTSYIEFSSLDFVDEEEGVTTKADLLQEIIDYIYGTDPTTPGGDDGTDPTMPTIDWLKDQLDDVFNT